MNRRDFIKALGAASFVAATGLPALSAMGELVGDIYYMAEGEALIGLRVPEWACLVVNKNFHLEDVHLSGTPIIVPSYATGKFCNEVRVSNAYVGMVTLPEGADVEKSARDIASAAREYNKEHSIIFIDCEVSGSGRVTGGGRYDTL